MASTSIDPKVFSHSQELRHNPTEAEQYLWQKLREEPFRKFHFRRQHPIGPYITDFCAIGNKLIIELDGGQHIEQEAYDQMRTEYLESRGFKVLRFWNYEVFQKRDAVCQVILDELNKQ